MTTTNPKSLILFFTLTMVLAIPSYVLIGLASRGVILTPDMGFAFVPLVTLAPLIAAMILTYRNGGWAATKSLLWRTFDFKRVTNKFWLIAALLTPIIIVALAWVLAEVFGLERLPAQLPLIAAPLVFLSFFAGALAEELGWMGYAYEPMARKWQRIKAALILGLLIGAFHIPIYYFLIDDPITLAIQSLFPVALRVLVIWIYDNAGKSIFAATIFHTAYNSCYSLFEVNIIVATMLSVIAAAAAIYFMRPRRMAE